jgi:hypothetical protein
MSNWSSEQDDALLEYLEQDKSMKEIIVLLNKSKEDIDARIKVIAEIFLKDGNNVDDILYTLRITEEDFKSMFPGYGKQKLMLKTTVDNKVNSDQFKYMVESEISSRHGKKWLISEEKKLFEMLAKKSTPSEIGAALGRSDYSVVCRIKGIAARMTKEFVPKCNIMKTLNLTDEEYTISVSEFSHKPAKYPTSDNPFGRTFNSRKDRKNITTDLVSTSSSTSIKDILALMINFDTKLNNIDARLNNMDMRIIAIETKIFNPSKNIVHDNPSIAENLDSNNEEPPSNDSLPIDINLQSNNEEPSSNDKPSVDINLQSNIEVQLYKEKSLIEENQLPESPKEDSCSEVRRLPNENSSFGTKQYLDKDSSLNDILSMVDKLSSINKDSSISRESIFDEENFTIV